MIIFLNGNPIIMPENADAALGNNAILDAELK